MSVEHKSSRISVAGAGSAGSAEVVGVSPAGSESGALPGGECGGERRPSSLSPADTAHPLARPGTELIWEGKYRQDGVRNGVDRSGAGMSLGMVEQVGDVSGGRQLHNSLILADNKLAMANLLRQHAGQVDLVYIDPPFDVGTSFKVNLALGERGRGGSPSPSAVSMVAYRDVWGRSTDSYLHFMYERLVLIRELLKESGSLYVHCDWHVSAYLRVMLDEIFGKECLLNEIVWSYALGGSSGDRFQRKHDTIFFYARNPARVWFQQPRDKATSSLLAGQPKGARDVWRTSVEDEHSTLLDAWPDDLIDYTVSNRHPERVGYPTQKPEAVLERVIASSCPPGGLVADFFGGSGTTAAVCERLGRRWLMVDTGRLAIHTSRKRMLNLHGKLAAEDRSPLPFAIYTLGRQERQWWVASRFGEGEQGQRAFRSAMVLLLGGEPLGKGEDPEPVLGERGRLVHGVWGGALVHVAGPEVVLDGPGVELLVAQMEAEAAGDPLLQKQSTPAGARCTILAWEYAPGLQITGGVPLQPGTEGEGAGGGQVGKVLGQTPILVKIPRDVVHGDGRGPSVWPLVPRVRVAVARDNEQARFTLEEFHPAYLRRRAGEGVRSQQSGVCLQGVEDAGLEHVDYWAVDPVFSPGGPFRPRWTSYRTRHCRDLCTTSPPLPYPQQVVGDAKNPAPCSSGSQGGQCPWVMVVDSLGFEWLFPVEDR